MPDLGLGLVQLDDKEESQTNNGEVLTLYFAKFVL